MQDALRDLLMEAGDVLRRRFREGCAHWDKDRSHPVTEADLEVERLLLRGLGSDHPHDSFDAEESGFLAGAGDCGWVLDALDGTANFLMGDPFFAVSLARLTEGRVTAGYVYCPMTDDLYEAEAGSSEALLNGEPISVSATSDLSHALVAFGFSARLPVVQRYHSEWTLVFEGCRKGVGWTAPAPALCNVARGRIDAFIDFGASHHGHAAGAIIAREAGAVVLGYDPGPYRADVAGVVACAPGLAHELKRARNAQEP